MRSILLILFFGLVSLGAYALEAPPNDKHCWIILKKNYSGSNVEFLSVINEMPKRAVRHKYPHLFIIKWGYEASPDGLPTEAAMIKGRTLYKEIDRFFGSNAVFALSRTGGGGRTMYYYASNSAKQGAALKQYFESGPPISIDIKVAKQPDWSDVQQVLSQVVERSGKAAGLTGCSRGQ